MTADRVKDEMQKVLLIKNGFNLLADVDTCAPLSSRTVSSYIKDMNCFEVVGKVQASSRVEPFNDIRNCIAKAAGMSALNEVVDQRHFHSDDEVGIFLFGWGKDATLP